VDKGVKNHILQEAKFKLGLSKKNAELGEEVAFIM